MPANESSMRVYFKERFHTKVVYEKYIFYKYWKGLLVKKNANYASTPTQINIY